ncbi:glycolate oxidase [Loktanella fryxellensis]|uniref:Glycolate oxidase n=1 Tax=Loktanella fryxellensis TaxID=245187 RepID=A0A1H8CSM2_9RHOB|nr:glycolate oxidase [Loktanella fryxellensis]
MQMPIPDARVLALKADLAARLRSVMPADAVIADPSETRAYECDGLSAYRCPPLLAVLPSTTQEVSDVLRICHAMGVPVVPRGSGTSLAGGAMPTADCVILGVARLNAVLEVDYADRIIRVQSGRTNLSVTGAVEAEGFFYAPDPSSQLACAIAGNIAMNSGGAHCLKYGVTTNNLLGVTMVLMDGTVIEVGGAHLDAPGLDLLGVICGSEGQLGVVTEATLRILRKPEGARPVMIGFDDNAVAGACVSDIIRAGVLPVAIEFMDRPCIRACEAFAKAGYPDCEALLIIEVEGSEAEITHQLSLIAAIAARHDPVEVREARDADQAARIWLGRKSAFGAMGQINDYMCLDGTIPVTELPHVLDRIRQMSAEYGLDVANVFHAGDGNMHPLILYNANTPGELEKCEALGAAILTLCVEVGGCLTGEHGVGIEKRDLMHVQFNTADLAAQMAVKDVFDPGWLLNPAKVFPLDVSEERRRGGGQPAPAGPRTSGEPTGALRDTSDQKKGLAAA